MQTYPLQEGACPSGGWGGEGVGMVKVSPPHVQQHHCLLQVAETFLNYQPIDTEEKIERLKKRDYFMNQFLKIPDC